MVTASIVVHKTPVAQLRKALGCLEESSVDKIYVIDNSPENNLQEISRGYGKVSYYHVPNNGFGAAHNIAIKKSFAEGACYHLVMNPDVYWEGDVISRICRYMEDNPDVGLVSPKTYYPDGKLQFTCRMLPTPVDMFFRGFLPSEISKDRDRKYLLKDFSHDRVLNCPYLLGSFMFFRVEALKGCGLFDERFFMYPEDIDITRRLHKEWKTVFFPDVSIIHEHQQASKKSLKMFGIHLMNMIKYFNKWGWFIDPLRKVYNKELTDEVKLAGKEDSHSGN